MDENYLDLLLKQVENPDNSINESKKGEDQDNRNQRLKNEETTPDASIEDRIAKDASSVRGVAWSDSEIPVEEISELDELDELADIDMDALDFEDIDFDDIDVTKMDLNPIQLEQELLDLENLSIDENYLDDSDDLAFEEEFKRMKKQMSGDLYSDNDFVDTMAEGDMSKKTDSASDSDFDSMAFESNEENGGSKEQESFDLDSFMSSDIFGNSFDSSTDNDSQSSDSESNGDSSTTEEFNLDDLMSEVFGEDGGNLDSSNPKSETETSTDDSKPQEDFGDFDFAQADLSANPFGEESESNSSSDSEMDDLFAMLGIENPGDNYGESDSSHASAEEIPDFEIPPELEDIPDISEKKKKKSFMDVLFGEDDEEDTLTPEQEAELAQKKEEKKQAKLAKKEASKEAKAQKAEKKKLEKENKTAQLNAKKAARKAEDERILAEDGPEKKLNIPLTIITIVIFLILGGFVIIGTNVFDYTLVVTKAQNYFERQKYGMAYREIVGVEVKEKDKDLESRIYTVMYVERQYEAYQNFTKMGRQDKALDSLLSGLDKYDDYYEEAVALDIVSDLDYAKAEIVGALNSVYGLSIEDANEILALDNDSYTRKIQEITADMNTSAE